MDRREANIAELATALRERLVEDRRALAAAGSEPGGNLDEAVRTLVEREAALLGAADRAELAARASATASASGRWRICSPIPRSRR
jgi:hypothetical protein